jgi:hypothetical protein
MATTEAALTADQQHKLVALFRVLWRRFVTDGGIDGPDLMHCLEASGLTKWREAEDADVIAFHGDIEVGDPFLCLNADGKAILD